MGDGMDGWGILCLFLVGWVVGALTFIPMLGLLFWAWGTTHISLQQPVQSDPSLGDASDLDKEADTEKGGLEMDLAGTTLDELKSRRHTPDVASGYFAVCREYVPGGINGKPPERTTPAGAVVATESPSVYQSMYRSIFDRNKTTSPSIDGAHGKSKKARNVFYVVLRLGHLMLYDDSEQLEVRHVISLAHHNVDIYDGGISVPEGELWIKRNCIRLTQRATLEGAREPKPFFLFSDNCSEKEDFYHAMLQSQEWNAETSQKPPLPLKFETPDLVRLVQQLHATEENLHTRWINALIGRLFLALYKSQHLERLIWTKITKKIARVPKPALVTSIQVQKIDMGNLPPFITNPKLKELTLDGDLTIEADVSYRGNFRLEISAVARIDLGSRFKAREVTFVLATILKKLEGHILLRMKPPPSNRMWFTFETAPKMELSLEPIVSSRQITYGVILRAIESRIREVVSETLVFPNWDDIPFVSTASEKYRGGIWEDITASEGRSDLSGNYAQHGQNVDLPNAQPEADDSHVPSVDAVIGTSIPASANTLDSEKSSLHSLYSLNEDLGLSTSVDQPSTAKPRALRSSSFASVASPIMNADPAIPRNDEHSRRDDAATSMRSTISKSPPSSPKGLPNPSTDSQKLTGLQDTSSSSLAAEGDNKVQERPSSSNGADFSKLSLTSGERHTLTEDSHDANSGYTDLMAGSASSLPKNKVDSPNRQSSINSSLNSATAAARKWISTRPNRQSTSHIDTSTLLRSIDHPVKTPQHQRDDHATGITAQGRIPDAPQVESLQHLRPIGGGRPLPPPGTPLPHPPKTEKRNWSVPAASTFANLTRRKPVVKQPTIPSLGEPYDRTFLASSPNRPMPAFGGEQKRDQRPLPLPLRSEASTSSFSAHLDTDKPPPLPKRRQRLSLAENKSVDMEKDLLVVEAPEGSAPTSPITPVGHVRNSESDDGVGETDPKDELM